MSIVVVKQCKTAGQRTMLVPVSLSKVLEDEKSGFDKKATDLGECVATENNGADT